MTDAPEPGRAPTARSGRRPLARHGVQSSPGPVAQLMKAVAIVLAVVLVSGVGVAAYTWFTLASTFADGSVDLDGQESVPPDIGAIEGGVNLLLAGTDACEPEYAQYFGDRCTGADAEAELNDVNMLVHISDEPRRVTVISFPRDLMVPIPSCTHSDGTVTSAMSKRPLNSAYTNGGDAGLACVVSTIAALTGQDIPFAAKVTWGGVIEVTNAVGGVEVCIANGIRDHHTGIDWEAGNRTIAGLEALQFLRTRHGVGNGGDLGRISNQQQYMSRLARKLISDEVLTNPATLYSLASTAVENVTPSKSLTNPLTLMQIALAVKDVPFEEIVFLQYPVVEDPDDPNKVVPDEAAAAALWAALEANQPIVLSGEASQGDGVVVVEPETPQEATPEEPATPADPGETAAPGETPGTVTTLPESITGQTAAQETCSNGNLGG
ncbi:LCP family protein [Microbacterium sp. zg.Y1084]|uniref:LCP family protein n=1 Tax=Microbacterium sp. zg.Y1084 TaxID=2969667 RepID=UPI00214C2F4B|nr:LCP family protein [Microbacterium sp. zg.Y1084]MCR2812348.1 LCP family protein [Microbacterium sp. zg.Y1084]